MFGMKMIQKVSTFIGSSTMKTITEPKWMQGVSKQTVQLVTTKKFQSYCLQQVNANRITMMQETYNVDAKYRK